MITDRGPVRLAPYLADSDMVVNYTQQDPNAPLIYMQTEDLGFHQGSAIRRCVTATRQWVLVGRPDGVRRPEVHRRPAGQLLPVDHGYYL